MENSLELNKCLSESGLINLFEVREISEYNDYTAVRVKSNIYKIRSFEIWSNEKGSKFRIYHASDIHKSLKEKLTKIDSLQKSQREIIDFDKINLNSLCLTIKEILLEEQIIEVCKSTSKRAGNNSRFAGLPLPDVDTNQKEIFGQTFSFLEVLSIFEDQSENNNLKNSLSKKGIYLQRTKDGVTRYVGSAYGSDGIIGRWYTHACEGGDAQNLKLYVTLNGYQDIEFTVLEIFDDHIPVAEIIQRETQWKNILGTINRGEYDGIRLNKN